MVPDALLQDLTPLATDSVQQTEGQVLHATTFGGFRNALLQDLTPRLQQTWGQVLHASKLQVISRNALLQDLTPTLGALTPTPGATATSARARRRVVVAG